jgi:hypothetical protein
VDQQILEIINKLPPTVHFLIVIIGTLCVLATGYIQSTKTEGLPAIGWLATLITKVESIPVVGSILGVLENFSIVQRKPDPVVTPQASLDKAA